MPIEIQTTKNKFIISIDKNRMDNDTFMRFVEYIKSKIAYKDEDVEVGETVINLERKADTKRFLAAQKFKGSAASLNCIYSKYNLYEQRKFLLIIQCLALIGQVENLTILISDQ